MSKHSVIMYCWEKGHITELFMTDRQENTLVRKISNLKAICPTCRNDGNGNQPLVILSGSTIFTPVKPYSCRHGHVTNIGAFTNGMLHIRFGPNDNNRENIEGTIEELEELIDKKTISCHHVRENGSTCGCKLKALNDVDLKYPITIGIKTKTRVGDIWDKNGVNPVRPGSYDKDGTFNKGTGQAGNEARLETMRKLNSKNSKSPGRTITKATTKQYKRRSKGSINIEKLK